MAYTPDSMTFALGLYETASGTRVQVTNADGAPLGDTARFGDVWLAENPGAVPNPIQMHFGKGMTLIGYDINNTSAALPIRAGRPALKAMGRGLGDERADVRGPARGPAAQGVDGRLLGRGRGLDRLPSLGDRAVDGVHHANDVAPESAVGDRHLSAADAVQESSQANGSGHSDDRVVY